ncbi:MAG: SIS domain-containing protein, partial [Armatimonadetes bacterium]|nr:SIS domain-containing protein [Armatimonadota bacterium]
MGAGTSGRLGVMDAAECPPTFGISLDLVQAVIAGGMKAILCSVEGAEDDVRAAPEDLKSRGFTGKDILVGISASGRTPYVLAGLRFARSLGAPVVGLTCNEDTEMAPLTDVCITV